MPSGVDSFRYRSTFLPFSPPAVGADEAAAAADTVRSGWITTGPAVANFEARFRERVNAEAVLATSSCTDALLIALAALGVGPGDAVYVPTMTFCATANVVEHLGAEPVLIDVDPTDLNISTSLLAAAIERTKAEGRLRPRAIIPVHYAGHPVDLDAVLDIATRHKLAVVEDAAHALPAAYLGRIIGDTSGSPVPRAVAFSFYATKNLTTAEGGMLAGSADLIEEARLWALHGMSRDAWKRYEAGGSWRYDVVRPGFKCNMTDIAASMGLVQLDQLDGFQVRRREIVEQYRAELGSSEALQLPVERPGVESAWHLFPVRLVLEALTIGRDEVFNLLQQYNIGASVHFIPIHLFSYYRDKYQLNGLEFPVATQEFERLISLPLHPKLSPDDVSDVCGTLKFIISRNSR